jgi:allophanate hydrolase subunit 2
MGKTRQTIVFFITKSIFVGGAVKMASDNNAIVGKWHCFEAAGGINMNLEFFEDGTYTYLNNTTGHRNTATYTASGNTATANNNGWKFSVNDNSLKVSPQGATSLYFKRV